MAETPAELRDGIRQRDAQLVELHEEILRRDELLSGLYEAVERRDEELSELCEVVERRDEELSELYLAIERRDERQLELYQAIERRDEELSELYKAVNQHDVRSASVPPTPELEVQDPSVADGTRDFAFLEAGYLRRDVLRDDYDDLANQDEFQKEVYDIALGVAAACGASTIIDFGCGSAFKLLRRFGSFEAVTGVDRGPIVAELRRQHPERTWLESPDTMALPEADVVIAADVLEHLSDPVGWVAAIADATRRFAVLSTPERGLLVSDHGHPPLGPPLNPHHHCEWTFDEFRRLVSTRFQIVHHEVVNRDTTTQLVIAKPNVR